MPGFASGGPGCRIRGIRGIGEGKSIAAAAVLARGEGDDFSGGALLADRGRWIAGERFWQGWRRARLRLIDHHDEWCGIGMVSREPHDLAAACGSADHQQTRE